MEQKILDKINIIRSKKPYELITAILFPALILLFCFAKVNQGADITDSTYSPTNFLMGTKLDNMWYISTFFANILGSVFVKLPLGNTLLGMNIYTGIIKSVTALLAYFFFVKTVKAPRELSFIGTIAAVGLCWCPTTILYNYLTFLLFLCGIVFLYKGIVKEKNAFLLIAGFFLGLNVFVRLSNACEAAAVVVLWAYCLLKDKGFKESFFKTLYCIGGYILGLIPGVVLISVIKGINAIPEGIGELFYMTEEASSYSVFGMLTQTVRVYTDTWPWIEITFFMLVLSLLAFLVLPTKLTWLRYILSTLITGGFVIFLYKKSLFTRDYRSYSSIYRFGALILIIMLIFFIIHALNRKNGFEERILAFTGIILIGITPIGSNNDIYSNLNNMFFVFPLFLMLLFRFVSGNEYFRGLRYSVLLLTMLFVFQSVMFGFNFVFRDGDYYSPRTVAITEIPAVKGMVTTEANKNELESFYKFWDAEGLAGNGILLYGDVSGLGFYLREEPAISTAWPSLASFSPDKFETQIKELEGRIDEKGVSAPPIILANAEMYGILNEPVEKKQLILNDYISKYDYKAIYYGDKFSVYAVR